MSLRTKSVTNQDLILAARQGLLPVSQRTWLGGLGNMLGKEVRQWWGTHLWWTQILICVLLINGVSTIVMLTETGTPAEQLAEVVSTFLPMSVIAISMGVVITVQGAVVGELQLGTAAWVMSKPASRSAFILSKALAYAMNFGVCAILIPSVIFLVEIRFMFPGALSLNLFLTGVAVVVVHQLFYLALTLMLGVLFRSRGAVAGIGIGFLMGGFVMKGFIPEIVMIMTPWPLQDIAGALALGNAMPPIWPVPVIASSIWAILMLAVALWRFNQEEF